MGYLNQPLRNPVTIRINLDEIKYRLLSLQYRVLNKWGRPEKKVLVTGTPKTGTYWMINMITSVPGYFFAGDFTHQHKRYYDTKLGAVLHAHHVYSSNLAKILQENNILVILTLRDPRDVVISNMFHARRVPKHPFYEEMQLLNYDEGIMACIEGRPKLLSIGVQMNVTQSWLDKSFPYCLVKYEDLIDAPYREMARVYQFLGFPLKPRLFKKIVWRNQFEQVTGRKRGEENTQAHLRKGIVGDWRNYFTEAHKQRFKELAGNILIDLGYEKDLDW